MNTNTARLLSGSKSIDVTAHPRQIRKHLRTPATLKEALVQLKIPPLSFWEIRRAEAEEVNGGTFVKAMYYAKEGLLIGYITALLSLALWAMIFHQFEPAVWAILMVWISPLLTSFGAMQFPVWDTLPLGWNASRAITPQGICIEIPFTARRRMEEIHKHLPTAKFYIRTCADDPFIIVEYSKERHTIAHF
jgi:hypothetical protein